MKNSIVNKATKKQIREMSTAKLEAYLILVDCDDEDAEEELDERRSWDNSFDDEPMETPELANCDDWGTGEGRWHGRM